MVKVKKQIKPSSIAAQIPLYTLCIFFCFICLFPFYMMLINATRSAVDINSKISFLPSNQFIENFKILLSLIKTNTRGNSIINPFIRSFLNSLIIAVSSTALSVYFSALTAFGFFNYKFKGSRFLYTFVLVTMMIPGQLGMIGFFKLVSSLNLIDTYVPLIVPAIASPGNVFFFYNYFKASYNKEIAESARIDGANEFRIFNQIIIPIALPAIATLSIFGIVGSWNSYTLPLIILYSSNNYTLPLMIALLRTNQYTPQMGAVYLGLLLSILPVIALYAALSKFIIRGVALGAVKE